MVYLAVSTTHTANSINLTDVFFAFTLIALLILAGRLIQQKTRWIQQLYLPESVVAGVLALLLGKEVLGKVVGAIATALPDSHAVPTSTLSSNLSQIFSSLSNGLFSAPIQTVWSQTPSVFINIVFAAMFLGEAIPNPRSIWRKAAPQVVFGQSIAWGQYVIGILVTLLILTPMFGISPIAGALIEIAFEGGHGTAAGMSETFAELGFPDGADLALGLATVGIVSGIVAGTALMHWGRRNGHIASLQTNPEILEHLEEHSHVESPEVRQSRARLMRNLLIDPLSLNFGFVGVAVVFGWLIQHGLLWLESVTWGQTGFEVMTYVPLFPMCLIGGIIVQLLLTRIGLEVLIIEPLMKNIAGVALDVVIVAALASISLTALGKNLGPFLILSGVGIAWNILSFIYLAPRLIPVHWFERGIGDMGQSMGVTATGILLMRMVDPHNRSGAFESFAYKQLFFEPIVGGGLFTAAAPVLLHNPRFGPLGTLLLTAGLLVFWLLVGFFVVNRKPQSTEMDRH